MGKLGGGISQDLLAGNDSQSIGSGSQDYTPEDIQSLRKRSFCGILDSKCSPLCQETNWKSAQDVKALLQSLWGRLTSQLTESLLCDILTFFDMHTLLNLPNFDNETQLRLCGALTRHFKAKPEKFESQQKPNEKELLYPEPHVARMDLLVFFYLNLLGPTYNNLDRHVCLAESVVEDLGLTILSHLKTYNGYFEEFLSLKALANQLVLAVEFQTITMQKQDTTNLNVLYKMVKSGLSNSPVALFECLQDQTDFLNNQVLRPLLLITNQLMSSASEIQTENLKKQRLLMQILLLWVSNAARSKNRHTFTVQVLDNKLLVQLVQAFSQVEVEQYSNLFERFSRSPKTVNLNLDTYGLVCLLLHIVVKAMGKDQFDFPVKEITQSSIFASALPTFLLMMADQTNIFTIGRASELHKFTSQLLLIYQFLHLLNSLTPYAEMKPLQEIYHGFSTGFMPQTLFFLAQQSSMYEQFKVEQLPEQYELWARIRSFQHRGKQEKENSLSISPLSPSMTQESLADLFEKARHTNSFEQTREIQISAAYQKAKLFQPKKTSGHSQAKDTSNEQINTKDGGEGGVEGESQQNSSGKTQKQVDLNLGEKEVRELRTRIQLESLILIGQFCEKISDSAHFVSSYLRELMLSILSLQNGRNFIPTNEVTILIANHTFLSHFASTSVLQSTLVHPTNQIYLCLELINIIYPLFEAQKHKYGAHLSILQESIFCLTDLFGGSQNSALVQLILLFSASQFRSTIFREEFARRLPALLQTVLKPKIIEECAGLSANVRQIMQYIQGNCLGFLAHDLIKTCALLIKPATQFQAPLTIENQTKKFDDVEGEDERCLGEVQEEKEARLRDAELRACEFPQNLVSIIKEWHKIRKRELSQVDEGQDQNAGTVSTSLLRRKNLPVLNLILEAEERFEEVTGVREDAMLKKKVQSVFATQAKKDKIVRNWSSSSKKVSQLAKTLLELIRVCIKDFQSTFVQEKYAEIETIVHPLLKNICSAALLPYRKQVLKIADTMIGACKMLSPAIVEILNHTIQEAENNCQILSHRTLTLLVSFGTSYFEDNQVALKRIAIILREQIDKSLSSLNESQKDTVQDDNEQIRPQNDQKSQNDTNSNDIRSSTKSIKKFETDNRLENARPYKVKEEELIESLLAMGILFLNNFNETICMEASETLTTVYEQVYLVTSAHDSQNDLSQQKIVVGEGFQVDQTKTIGDQDQLQIQILLLTCCIFYQQRGVALEFFNQNAQYFKVFLALIQNCVSPGSPADDPSYENPKLRLLTVFETKIITCGLSKAFFGTPNSIKINPSTSQRESLQLSQSSISAPTDQEDQEDQEEKKSNNHDEEQNKSETKSKNGDLAEENSVQENQDNSEKQNEQSNSDKEKSNKNDQHHLIDIGIPFESQQMAVATVVNVAKQISLALYWLKFEQDCSLYFNEKGLFGRSTRVIQKVLDKVAEKEKSGRKDSSQQLQPSTSQEEEDEEFSDETLSNLGGSDSQKDSENSDEDSSDDEGQLVDYLLQNYIRLTPQILIIDEQLEKYEMRPFLKQKIGENDKKKHYEKLSFCLQNIDEFVNFKKYMVNALGSDKDNIQRFISQDADLVKLSNFVFRCRRIRFTTCTKFEQIRLIYNFQM